MKAQFMTALAGLLLAGTAQAEATHQIKLMTPETALKAAQAALKSCRDSGYQVAVAVVDRMGVVQVLLRDRYAGAHTPRTARAKAWSAVSFRTNSSDLAEISQAGKPQSGIRQLPGVAAIGGGMMIEASGSLLGAIGISGAPGGEEDDKCAAAGVAAIRTDIEF